MMNRREVDRDHQSADMSNSRSSLEAATEAAQRINALLIAKGMLKPSQVSSVPHKTKQQSTPVEVRTFCCRVPHWASGSSEKMIIAEVDINSQLPACRNNLTRTSTQEEITRISRASVATRGRFMAEEELSRAEPGDRPLYLRLEASTQDAIEKAVARIQEIIDGKNLRRDFHSSAAANSQSSSVGWTAPLSSSSGISSSLAFLSEKLMVGLEHAPPNFDVKSKLLGPGGTYLYHIQQETGAKVLLRGRGSGFLEPNTGFEACEPLSIFVQHATTQGLQDAKQLSKNLIETVQNIYADYQRDLAVALARPAGAPALMTGLAPQTLLVGSSLPSSLSVMPVAAAAAAAPSQLGLAIAPPGPAVLLDSSLPPSAGIAAAHYQPVTSQPPTQTILGVIPTSVPSFVVDNTVPPPPLAPPIVSLDGGGLMSVQPTTSFVLTQPPQPPPGSLVLTHRPGLASGSIVLSQPVAPEPPETIVLGHRGPSVPGSFVLTQPAPQPGTIVISQPCSAGAAAAPIGPFVPMLPAGADSRPQVSEGMATLSELQAAPVFSQAGRRHGVLVSKMDGETRGLDVSVYHIPSGSQLTVLQPVPGQQDPGSSGGPSAIYTLSRPAQQTFTASEAVTSETVVMVTTTTVSAHDYYSQNATLSTASTVATSEDNTKTRSGPRKRRFMETEEDVDYSNLLGYRHGPPHLLNTLTVSSASDGSSNLTATSRPSTEPQKPSDETAEDVSNTGTTSGSEVDSLSKSQSTSDVRSSSSGVAVSQYSAKPLMYSAMTEPTMSVPTAAYSGESMPQPPYAQPAMIRQILATEPGGQPPATAVYHPAGQPEAMPCQPLLQDQSALFFRHETGADPTAHFVLPTAPASTFPAPPPPQFMMGQQPGAMERFGAPPPPLPPPLPTPGSLPYPVMSGVNSAAGGPVSYWMTLN